MHVHLRAEILAEDTLPEIAEMPIFTGFCRLRPSKNLQSFLFAAIILFGNQSYNKLEFIFRTYVSQYIHKTFRTAAAFRLVLSLSADT